QFCPIPDDQTIIKVGYGFGNRETPQLNALRVMLCEKKKLSQQVIEEKTDQILVLEANIDDQSAESLAPVLDL
ncbi:nickel insertion protein, partial [Latilactobacillus curvatus]